MPTAFFFPRRGFFTSLILAKSYSFFIKSPLSPSRFPSRDEPDHCVIAAIAVDHDEKSRDAPPHGDKSLFTKHLIGENPGMRILEHGSTFLKPNTMLGPIASILPLIPLELDII